MAKARQTSGADGRRGKRLLRSTGLILAVLILASVMTVLMVAMGLVHIPFIETLLEKLHLINTRKTGLDNGDRVSTPTEEHVVLDPEEGVLYFDNQLVVYTFSDLSARAARELAELVDGTVVGDISGCINVLQIEVDASSLEDLQDMADRLMREDDVMYASYDYPVDMTGTEADSNPWSENSNAPAEDRGNESHPAGNDWWAEAIGAYTAWSYSSLCAPVKVGILDSGFDKAHEDLAGTVSFLPDYIENSASDHGTHVAGIIGAHNNSVGMRGIADQASMICASWMPRENVSYLSSGDYLEIFKQMIENDVKVINNSWGAKYYSESGYALEKASELYPDNDVKFLLEYFVLKQTGAYESYVDYMTSYAERTSMDCLLMMVQLMQNGQKDFLFVQSAGNGYYDNGQPMDTSKNGHFCSLDETTWDRLLGGWSDERLEQLEEQGINYRAIDDRILIVGAIQNQRDENGNYAQSSFSNYGDHVDICAPGTDIFSTYWSANAQTPAYRQLNGTSMAAPMVTGSAALLWSLEPDLTVEEVRSLLLDSTVTRTTGQAYRVLNIGSAVRMLKHDLTYGDYQSSDLPNGVVEWNGHFYYLYEFADTDSTFTWDAAREFCESKNGYLATITSKEEDEFLFAYMKSRGRSNAYFGLNDAEEEGNWVWANGEALTYTNWHSGEPNNQNRNEDYGMYDSNYGNGTWNDGDFSDGTAPNDKAFLCEWGAYTRLAESSVHSDEQDIVLVLDVSGSMDGKPMEETKEAAQKFIETVLQGETKANVGIVTYNSNARCISSFADTPERQQQVISGLYAGGNTNIEEGLFEAKAMLDAGKARKKIIVLMSDGEPNRGKSGDALVAYSDTIKADDVTIYTLGFFDELGDRKAAAQQLMERIASRGCHYEVENAEDLSLFFEDMADQISGQKYIYIRIEGAVDVIVSRDGESLSSVEDEENLRTDFGTLTFEENETGGTDDEDESESGSIIGLPGGSDTADDEDDRVKILRLKEGAEYLVQLIARARSQLSYAIGFMNNDGQYSDLRRFEDLSITRKTIIDTIAGTSEQIVLHIDDDGDGEYDRKFSAGYNAYGEEVAMGLTLKLDWVTMLLTGGTILVLMLGCILAMKKASRRTV